MQNEMRNLSIIAFEVSGKIAYNAYIINVSYRIKFKKIALTTENLYLFLDESGDLGFDWTKGGTSLYFIITLLVCKNAHTVKNIKFAVQKTLKNKVNHKKNKTRIMNELKGGNIELPIKKYFFNHLPPQDWGI